MDTREGQRKEIARRLIQARATVGLSLADVGLRLDMARQTIHQLEQGERDLRTGELLRLCEILDCCPLWLLTGLAASGCYLPDIVVPTNPLDGPWRRDKHSEDRGKRF